MKKQSIIKMGILVSSLLTSSITLAGQAIIPNTFSAGTPAVAAEVNQNFTSIESAVNDNDNRINTNTADIATNAGDIASNTAAINALNIGGLKVFANGVDIGYLTWGTEYDFKILSNTGFFVALIHDGSIIGQSALGYDQPGCTGNLYAFFPNYYPGMFSVYGMVYYSPELITTFYIPKNQNFYSVDIYSRPLPDGGCENLVSPVQSMSTLAIPNNEAITGIPNSGFVGPITFVQ